MERLGWEWRQGAEGSAGLIKEHGRPADSGPIGLVGQVGIVEEL
jgi:hypothetical protein